MHSGTPLHTAPSPWRALVLGGARSGKSAFAERLLADDEEVLYAATAPHYDGDAEWAERIAQHRAARPSTWLTAELGGTPAKLADVLLMADRTVLVDSLTLWLTAAMDAVGAWDDEAWREGTAREALSSLVSGLVDAYSNSARSVVVVSDEVGFGVVPESASTRRFRDELGRLNQALAAVADEVTLVVAGIPARLKPGPGALGAR